MGLFRETSSKWRELRAVQPGAGRYKYWFQVWFMRAGFLAGCGLVYRKTEAGRQDLKRNIRHYLHPEEK